MSATPPPTSPPPRRARRWPMVLAVVAVLLVVAVFVASRIQLNDYSLTPGQAQPVGPLISVPAAKDHHHRGPILLTDVLVSQLTLLGYIPAWLDGNAQIVSAGQLLGPYTPPSELAAQGYLQMAQAQSAAKAAALTRLGYNVAQSNGGVVLYAVRPGAPAAAASLQVAEIVHAVNGTPTPDVCSFLQALSPYGPGDTVRLSVEQSTVTPEATIVPGKVVVRQVRLGRRPADAGASGPTGCPGVQEPKGYLGVAVETQVNFAYPIRISINTSQIGGPSAGLAMTLGIIDKLTDGSLTDGRTVAATGTIDPQGDVGDVGGVPQKTVAVEQAGATVFFVPPQELANARSKATPQLHIFAVSSLNQALDDLRSLGGHVPPALGKPPVHQPTS